MTPSTSTPIAVPVGAGGRPEAPYRLLRGGTIDGPASGGLVVYGKDGVIACGRRGMAEHSRVGWGRAASADR